MKYLYRILLIILIFNCFTQRSYSVTNFQQTIVTKVPSAVNISTYNQSLAIGNIDPQTGMLSSPSASFNIQTNGEDVNYTYTVQAKVSTSNSGDVNAYLQNSNSAYIILGNIASSNLPDINAINDIKSGTPTIAENPNAIAYPITNILTNIESATITNNPTDGDLCYSVKMGESQSGNLVQNLGSTPLPNTYSLSNDRAGTYQAVITFTANRNP